MNINYTRLISYVLVFFPKRSTLSQIHVLKRLKLIVHFEINLWYVLDYLEGIQDVAVFVSAVVSIFIFLGQTVGLSVI